MRGLTRCVALTVAFAMATGGIDCAERQGTTQTTGEIDVYPNSPPPYVIHRGDGESTGRFGQVIKTGEIDIHPGGDRVGDEVLEVYTRPDGTVEMDVMP